MKNFLKPYNINKYLWSIIIIFLILYALGNLNQDILILFSITILNLFFNTILLIIVTCGNQCPFIDTIAMYKYCENTSDSSCKCNKNNLSWDYYIRIKWIKKCNWIIEKLFADIIYNIYLRIDLLYNIIKFRHNRNIESKRQQDILLDFVIIIFLIIGLFFFNTISNTNNDFCSKLAASFFIWRIITIFFIKLNEIISFSLGGKYHNFNRSVIFLFINLTELVIGYSFLYSSNYFNIIKNRNFATIFETLHIFTDWTYKTIDSLCLEQRLLILSQIVIFIILIMVFLAALPSFPFKRK